MWELRAHSPHQSTYLIELSPVKMYQQALTYNLSLQELSFHLIHSKFVPPGHTMHATTQSLNNFPCNINKIHVPVNSYSVHCTQLIKDERLYRPVWYVPSDMLLEKPKNEGFNPKMRDCHLGMRQTFTVIIWSNWQGNLAWCFPDVDYKLPHWSCL